MEGLCRWSFIFYMLFVTWLLCAVLLFALLHFVIFFSLCSFLFLLVVFFHLFFSFALAHLPLQFWSLPDSGNNFRSSWLIELSRIVFFFSLFILANVNKNCVWVHIQMDGKHAHNVSILNVGKRLTTFVLKYSIGAHRVCGEMERWNDVRYRNELEINFQIMFNFFYVSELFFPSFFSFFFFLFYPWWIQHQTCWWFGNNFFIS